LTPPDERVDVAWERKHVLGALFVIAAAVAAVILADVASTVFLTITVAYLLAPLRTRLVARGLSPWWATLVATLLAFLAVVVAVTPLAVVLLLRLDALLAFVGSIPDTIHLRPFGFTYTVTLEEVTAFATALVTTIAREAATAVPVLALKLTLFAFLLFGLLANGGRVRTGLLAVVPAAYRDLARALHRRTRETLFALYVLQAATALGTFLVALPVFFALGYSIVVTLATVAAVLQFLPIVGPSILVVVLAAYHVVVGDPVQAGIVAVVGLVLVGWLPDAVIRPRLAKETSRLPVSLYFVGFVGGVLTLGPVGIIAGPLAVALAVELADLLSAELNDVPVEED
jgi:predicted PurR-regulated permease PerM